MSPRRIIFLAVALLASFATIFLGKAYLGADRTAPAAAPVPVATEEKAPTMILVARGDLPVGKILRAENLRWQNWPDDGISPSYAVQGKKNIEDFDGYAVRSSLIDGEPITEARVVSPMDRGFLAAVIKPGNRAVTVALTPSSGNAGFIFPGDVVDVLATLALTEEDNGEGKTSLQHHATETVLTKIRVLGIDQRADAENREVSVAKTATLEVTPKEAEILSVVSEIGKISLALRSLPMRDDQLAMEEDRTGRTFTFDSEATGLIRPPNSSSTTRIVVVRGSEAKTIDFIRPGAASSGMGQRPPHDENDEDH
jgi:pilus assembly protein CpaB